MVPQEAIREALAANGKQTQRQRKLNLELTTLLLIGMQLWSQLSIKNALHKLMRGLQLVWPKAVEIPTAGALCYRRYQLGAGVMQTLFRRVCRPIATEETIGAFAFGLRLMALDGSTESVPDTPANRRAFGKRKGGHGEGAFPQVQTIYLVECGTHAIVDAGFWPGNTNERKGGRRLLRSVEEGMLVMWDAGFYAFDLFAKVRAKRAHFLCRLAGFAKPRPEKVLEDKSWLTTIKPSKTIRGDRNARLTVRVIEYCIKDPALDKPDKVHRLVTSLLDPQRYPARELICLYHERWETEIVIDELDTHQLYNRLLRSKKPVGVIQELYALLIAHFVLRFIMHQAALQARIDPDRLSFTDSLERLKDTFRESLIIAPSDHCILWRQLISCLPHVARLPPRRLRIYPRVVRKRLSQYKRKRARHYLPRQPAGSFADALVLI